MKHNLDPSLVEKIELLFLGAGIIFGLLALAYLINILDSLLKLI